MRVVKAVLPDGRPMWYLVNENLDFVQEVKQFLDLKMAVQRSPDTVKAYCWRLSWFYRFLGSRGLSISEAQPQDLTDFVLWLCNPLRDVPNVSVIHQQSPMTAATVNLILQAVSALYSYLVRRGDLVRSPVVFDDVVRSRWLTERDLLAHTRRGHGGHTVKRMTLKLREPRQLG